MSNNTKLPLTLDIGYRYPGRKKVRQLWRFDLVLKPDEEAKPKIHLRIIGFCQAFNVEAM